jgi:type I restriction enzyme S subunit
MQQLLTGKTRLPGFSGAWETRRLGDCATFLRNGAHSRAELDEESPVRNLHYGDIHASTSTFFDAAADEIPRLAPVKARGIDRLTDGDLVFVDASEDTKGVGKAVEVIGCGGVELVAGLHTIAVRFSKSTLADRFKAFLPCTPAFRDQLLRLAAGTKVLATSSRHIASVTLPLPSLAEQRAIAEVLTDLDAELAALEARREKTRLIKQGMMQALLTGQVRLV